MILLTIELSVIMAATSTLLGPSAGTKTVSQRGQIASTVNLKHSVLSVRVVLLLTGT